MKSQDHVLQRHVTARTSHLAGLVAGVVLCVLGGLALVGAFLPRTGGPVAVIRLSIGEPGRDIIGPHVSAQRLRKAIELIDFPDGGSRPILILEFDSSGGMLREAPRLSDLIEYELKPRYRVVGWIRRAESAAALVALTIPELIMRPEGTLGGALTYVRKPDGERALEGEALETALLVGREMARRGGYSPKMVGAMQAPCVLSCDVYPDGSVIWYEDEQGDLVLNDSPRILTLNSQDAWRVRVSRGTASTLTEVMQVLGVSSWRAAGADAERRLQDDRARADAALEEARRLLGRLRSLLRDAEHADLSVDERRDAERMLEQLGVTLQNWPEVAAYLGVTAERLERWSVQLG